MQKDQWGQAIKPTAKSSWRQRRSAQRTPSTEQRTEQRAWQLIDKTLQSIVAEQRRARRWRIFFFLLVATFVGLSFAPALFFAELSEEPDLQSWLGVPGPYVSGGDIQQPHVALIRLEGLIAIEDVNADWINSLLREAMTNDNARAVILKINSPGGSPVQAERIYAELRRLRQLHDKPVYAVIEDLGASAAYYIAAGSDQIFANVNSLVGSIGVISPSFGFVDLMEKIGVERRVQTAGDNKAFLDPFQDLEPAAQAFWQDALDRIHQNFINAVEATRSGKIRDKNAVYSGLIYTGDKALELGLIDGYADSSQLARERIGVEEVVDYSSRSQNIFDFISDFAASTLWRASTKFNQPYLQ